MSELTSSKPFCKHTVTSGSPSVDAPMVENNVVPSVTTAAFKQSSLGRLICFVVSRPSVTPLMPIPAPSTSVMLTNPFHGEVKKPVTSAGPTTDSPSMKNVIEAAEIVSSPSQSSGSSIPIVKQASVSS